MCFIGWRAKRFTKCRWNLGPIEFQSPKIESIPLLLDFFFSAFLSLQNSLKHLFFSHFFFRCFCSALGTVRWWFERKFLKFQNKMFEQASMFTVVFFDGPQNKKRACPLQIELNWSGFFADDCVGFKMMNQIIRYERRKKKIREKIWSHFFAEKK